MDASGTGTRADVDGRPPPIRPREARILRNRRRDRASARELPRLGWCVVTLWARQAWKIAARLRPEANDLRVTALARSRVSEGGGDSVRRVPASGYVGRYPPREREARGEDE